MKPISAAQRRARVAAVFDTVADVYDNVGVDWFTPIARMLVDQLGPRPGERAVDLGCGRGAALFALAERVGPDGHVTGIDLSPRMVDATRAAVAARGLSHVDLHVMDAGAPAIEPHSQDVAASSFVLFFLPAPVAALRAWRRLLVPGGRLGLSTFGESGAGWLDDVFRPFLPASEFPASSAFDSDAGVEELVRRAGFDDVRTVTVEFEAGFDDLDQWHAWSWSHGQRATWERIPVANHGKVRAAAAERLRPHRRAGGRIVLPQQIRLTLATA